MYGSRGLGDDSGGLDDGGDYGFEDDGIDIDYAAPPSPTTIALQTGSSAPAGAAPATTPPPLVNYQTPPTTPTGLSPTGVALAQAFKNPDGSPTYDGAPYSATDLLNPYNLSHLFGGLLTTLTGGTKSPTGLPVGSVAPASTIGGVKTSTLAIAAVVAGVAYFAFGRKS